MKTDPQGLSRKQRPAKAGAPLDLAAPAHHDDPINILLVDDEPKNLTALEVVLDNPDYRLIRATGADEALLALVTYEFALLVLDIQMPGMNGFELANMIKQRKKTAGVPIIFLTAYYSEDQHILEGYGTGAVDYLHKPINATALRAKVAVFAELHRKTREVTLANTALLAEVAERRQAQEQLRELNDTLEQRITKRTKELLDSERRFREMLDALPAAIYTTDGEGLLTYYNPACVEFSGRVPQIGNDLWCVSWKLFHADGTPLTDAEYPMAMALKSGDIIRGVEVIAERPDGTRIWFTPYPTPFRDAQGRVTGGINMLMDITEQKKAEQLLRESEESFRLMANAIPQLAWMGLPDGHIFWYNQRWYDYTGTAPEQMEGWGWQSVHDPIKLPKILEQWKDSIASGELFEMTLPLRGADGLFRLFLTRAIPLKDATGRVVRWFGTNTDIDELKRTEAALAERTTELIRADRNKDEFLAMLAHELRNPLAPLRSAAEILRTPDASSEERRQAQRILNRQIENMTRMIDDLLDVSRITEGRIELRCEPVTLEAILTASASLVRSSCAAHDQKFVLSLPAEPVYLTADSTRLEQVFSNLLTNACKYSGDGSHIWLSAERAAGIEPPEVIIRVRDDGHGIAPELLPCIFDLFVQASRALDRSHGGLGIGLTLVQRLVKLHGGRIEAHSEGLGQGSEFTVYLPILSEAPPLPTLPAPPVDRDSPRRILIVDDNTDSARGMAMLQSHRGHETRTAFTGPDAVIAAAEFLPEIVLLDIGLPGMDGFEVARRIRAMPELAGVFIIAMSGYGREEDRAEAQLAGFDEYLVKPVDLDQLRELLRRSQHAPQNG